MTSEQLRKFLYTKSPAGSKRVALIKDEGLGQQRVVASWDREEVEQAADPALAKPDVVALLLEAAQEEADNTGDVIKFTIAWQDARMAEMKSCTHIAAPASGDKAAAPSEYKGGPISANVIVGELLAALLAKDKQMNAATQTLTSAYDRALGHQQRAIETLSRAVDTLQVQVQANGAPTQIVVDADVKEAQLATHRMKQQAFGKLLEKGPEIVSDIVKVVAQVAAEKAMGVSGAPTTKPPGPNGAAKGTSS